MVYEIRQTGSFARWLTGLRDLRARIAIARRIERAAAGNLGNVKPLRDGVAEMRIDVGAGYRLYFTRREGAIVILLAGGDKSSQERDIRHAIDLAWEF